jgi:hypothetical protein
MVGRVYSNFQLACTKAIELSREIAEDVFVHQHCYPSGMEFELTLTEGGLFSARISHKQVFPTKEQAERYKQKFEVRLNKRIFVKEKVRVEKGYKYKEGYILCFA